MLRAQAHADEAGRQRLQRRDPVDHPQRQRCADRPVGAEHPALLRVRELETLGALAANPGARLYIGFDKHSDRLTAE